MMLVMQSAFILCRTGAREEASTRLSFSIYGMAWYGTSRVVQDCSSLVFSFLYFWLACCLACCLACWLAYPSLTPSLTPSLVSSPTSDKAQPRLTRIQLSVAQPGARPKQEQRPQWTSTSKFVTLELPPLQHQPHQQLHPSHNPLSPSRPSIAKKLLRQRDSAVRFIARSSPAAQLSSRRRTRSPRRRRRPITTQPQHHTGM